ncbi:aminotransferase class IV [Kitasatospora cathayae]|uniref:Aminotransferase class IV n=1 Tax=Kitasatospora cathayae TaxID=3004092 RepID=A0ABY7PZB2_9ACTN|nr:aminotransferase class IV [Kitasatospora sp. HUAS 3-15]WBP85584.1 aminotransferase class IV [Kitasatospora sp. HUAS 3-15]
MEELDERQLGVDEITSLALTGYGHFTTMRVEGGAIRGLGLHFARLARDCRTVFGAELNLDQVSQELCRAVDLTTDDIIVRITVFDPDLSLPHPAGPAAPRILVTTRPAPAVPQGPMRVQPVRHLRQVAGVKHTGLFDSLHLRRAAQLDGFDDALFHGDELGISEGATWNVGFFDGHRVVWPQAEHLPGVTEALLTGIHERCVSRTVTLDQLPAMEAAFATNAAVGVRPISAIGSVPFAADHPILAELRDRYAEIEPEQPR